MQYSVLIHSGQRIKDSKAIAQFFTVFQDFNLHPSYFSRVRLSVFLPVWPHYVRRADQIDRVQGIERLQPFYQCTGHCDILIINADNLHKALAATIFEKAPYGMDQISIGLKCAKAPLKLRPESKAPRTGIRGSSQGIIAFALSPYEPQTRNRESFQAEIVRDKIEMSFFDKTQEHRHTCQQLRYWLRKHLFPINAGSQVGLSFKYGHPVLQQGKLLVSSLSCPGLPTGLCGRLRTQPV